MNHVVSPSFLKQKARQLKKEKGLSQSEALNEASKQLDYSNYKNYLNVLKANREQSENSKEVLLRTISSEKIASKKVDLAVSFLQSSKIPFRDLLDILELFKHSKKSLNSVCEKSTLKAELQTYLFNDFLTDESKDEIQMWEPYFVAKEIFLKNLIYEIKDDLLCVEGDYDLEIKFEYDLDENEPESKDDRFKDRWLFGSFEITIDRNKKITFVNSDIGQYADGGRH